ncbi:MAG: YbhN family protein [Candidatus Nanosalina sp.]
MEKGRSMRSEIKQFKNSKVLWYGISTAILLGLIYLADVKKFLSALKDVDPIYMSAAFISGLSVFLVWGYIWHSFFRKLNIDTELLKSYNIFMAGNFMNSITPFGQLGGEPVMAYVISRNTGAKYEKSLSTVMSADIINAVPFLTYASAGILYILLFGTLNSIIRAGIYAVILLNITFLFIAYLAWFKIDKVEETLYELLNYIKSRFTKSERFISSLKERVRTLKESFKKAGEDRGHLVKMGLISHLAPITQFLCLYLILLGLESSISFIGIYFTVILAGLAMFSPTPGGAGTFEAVFSALLMFFHPGMALDTAVASAVLFRLTTFWPGLLIGYLALLSLRGGADK